MTGRPAPHSLVASSHGGDWIVFHGLVGITLTGILVLVALYAASACLGIPQHGRDLLVLVGFVCSHDRYFAMLVTRLVGVVGVVFH